MKIILMAGFFAPLKFLISATTPSGAVVTKVHAAAQISLFIAPITYLATINSWYEQNSAYVTYVMLAVFLDWFLGTIKHALYIRDFSWKENIKGIVVKTLLVLIIGFLFEGIQFLTVGHSSVTKYIVTILRLTVFLYPATAAIRSSRVISGGTFPPQGIYDAIEGWMDKFLKQNK